MVKSSLKAVLFASVFSLLISGLITAGALAHNIQCEFYCEGEVHWGHLLALFVGWFVITFPAGVIFAGLLLAFQAWRR